MANDAWWCAIVAVTATTCAAAERPHGTGAPQKISRGALCVTNGIVAARPDGRLAVDTSSSRAVLGAAEGQRADQAAEIRFRYLGPTVTGKALASGRWRRQIGLKLQAQDSCNLVYVMWRIEPASGVVVSVKRNPGMTTHAQCHAGGYVTVAATAGVALPPIRPGEAHMLRAELRGGVMRVTADGKAVWQGPLGDDAVSLRGPVGFRTDNGRFELDLWVDAPAGAHAGGESTPAPRRCAPVEGD